jgi:uncharacterized protein (TIGR03083 family)
MANQPTTTDAPETLESLWRWWAERVATLDPAQLATPTRCGSWTVHDLVAHATPDPGQLDAVLANALDAPPEVTDGASLLRAFNAPGGLAYAMADDIAAAATAAVPALPPETAARRFEAAADLVARTAYDPHAVLPYPGVGSLTAAALNDVAIVDATVHGLDLVAAIGGTPPPEPARAHTCGVLTRVPDLDELIDVLTGRRDPSAVLPVMR